MAAAFQGYDAVCSYRGGQCSWLRAAADAGALKCSRAGLQLACACRWLAGAYFMLVTMLSVGYGDITPHTNQEIIVTMFSLIAGIIFFGILLGSIAEALNVSTSLASICHSHALRTACLLSHPRQQYSCAVAEEQALRALKWNCTCGYKNLIRHDAGLHCCGPPRRGHGIAVKVALTTAVHLPGLREFILNGRRLRMDAVCMQASMHDVSGEQLRYGCV